MNITEDRIKELINEALEPFESDIKEDIREERRVEMAEKILEGVKKGINGAVEDRTIVDGVMRTLTDVDKINLAEGIQEYITPRGSSRMMEYPLSFHSVDGVTTIKHEMGKKPTGFVNIGKPYDSRPEMIKATNTEVVFRTHSRGGKIRVFLIAEDDE